MVAVAVFAAVLLLSVLFSELAHRSVLSMSLLFLVAGFATGSGMLDLVSLAPRSPVVARLAEIALFAVLFTDGMRTSASDLSSAWKLPGRALLLGMPLTFAAGAALAHWLVGLPWPQACLVGAVLSPTDPVLAAAIVGREEIPWRLRHLLNVESGLNDGMALPVVLALLALVGGQAATPGALVQDVAFGLLLGIALPWLAVRIEGSRVFAVSEPYAPLFVFAVGLLLFSLCELLQANAFLAAFAGGVTIASVRPTLRDQFRGFGDSVAELFKLAALLVFGALMSPAFLLDTQWTTYLFALLMLIAVRPLTLILAFLGSRLDWRERIVAAWFGPKGFASVVFGLMIYNLDIDDADELFHLVALSIVASIIAHSSTDELVSRWLRRSHDEEGAAG